MTRYMTYRAKLWVIVLLALPLAGFAQYDDLYYNPDRDRSYDLPTESDRSSSNNDDWRQQDEGEWDSGMIERAPSYDNEAYEFEQRHDYYYTSRIRRFHRPYYGFGFYDPIYVDRFYYDPFFAASPFAGPALTTLIYDPVVSVNFGFGFGFGNPFVSPFVGYNPWAWNPWFGPRWGWNRPGWGWGSPRFGGNNVFINNTFIGAGGYYCPPSWGGNNVYVTNVSTTYGPRTQSGVRPPASSTRNIQTVTSPSNGSVIDRSGNTRTNTRSSATQQNNTNSRSSGTTRSSTRQLDTRESSRSRSNVDRSSRSRDRSSYDRSSRSRSNSRSYNRSNSRSRSPSYNSRSNSSRSRSYNSPSRSNSRSYSSPSRSAPSRSYSSPSRGGSSRSYSSPSRGSSRSSRGGGR